MSRKKRNSNKYKDVEIFLYGKRLHKYKAVAYCKLHKCYLEPIDIKEKGCNWKGKHGSKCNNLQEI